MFNLLLNTLHGFYDVFLNCTFKGVPVVQWGFFAFILGVIVRFLFPMLHMNLGSGVLVGSVAEAFRVSGKSTSDVGMTYTTYNKVYGGSSVDRKTWDKYSLIYSGKINAYRNH